VSLNPATPVAALESIVRDIDLLLIMSVDPGFGGQSYIPSSTEKIRQASEMLRSLNADASLEVDGGIDIGTAKIAAGAGANILVAGNYIFGSSDVVSSIRTLRAIVGRS
jgi:ribulose-phosphate 3-epimerase